MTRKKSKQESPIRFNVAESKGEIWIHSLIGEGFFGGISSEDVANALKEMGDVEEIDVHINSRGGFAFEGIAIYNLFKDHDAEITILIEGIAASVASVIAMAGDKIEIAENGMVMIHDGAAAVFGGIEDFKKEIEILEKINAIIVETYSSRTGQTAERIAEMMGEETWLTAKEALEDGFVDSISKNKAKPPENSSVKNWSDFMKTLKKEFQMTKPENKAPEKSGDPKPAENQPVLDPENQVPDPPADPKPKEPENKTDKTPVDSPNPVMAEQSRIIKIDALCEMAEVSDKNRRSFIQNNFTVEETQNAIKEILGKKNAIVPEGVDPPEAPKKDPDKKYRDEYNEQKEIYQQSGTTVEDYIETRKIDDGEAQLQDPRTHLPVESAAA